MKKLKNIIITIVVVVSIYTGCECYKVMMTENWQATIGLLISGVILWGFWESNVRDFDWELE